VLRQGRPLQLRDSARREAIQRVAAFGQIEEGSDGCRAFPETAPADVSDHRAYAIVPASTVPIRPSTKA
jgi:hypothetical protein